ncbi:hypothetical protein ACJMK2_034112 [Sinanodonta woodiana]|uniref:Complex 1 LYR protein domain-containing protein n=1 Tax=Sinanodonta woodiana TaxID=1069815 RepID=A0ABD3WSP6_SINWO
MALQQEVLALYRCIFRLARKWTSLSGKAQDTREEQEYIRTEAKTLFKKNKKITDESQIRQHIKEAEARIEIAQHYRIPYPRPVNIPQNVLAPTSAKLKKKQKQQIEQSKPIYLKSYEDT